MKLPNSQDAEWEEGAGLEYHNRVLRGIEEALGKVHVYESVAGLERAPTEDRQRLLDMMDGRDLDTPDQVDLTRIAPTLDGMDEAEALRTLTHVVETIPGSSPALDDLCRAAFAGPPIDTLESAAELIRTESCGLYSDVLRMILEAPPDFASTMTHTFFRLILSRIKSVLYVGSMSLERLDTVRWLIEDLESENMKLSQRLEEAEAKILLLQAEADAEAEAAEGAAKGAANPRSGDEEDEDDTFYTGAVDDEEQEGGRDAAYIDLGGGDDDPLCRSGDGGGTPPPEGGAASPTPQEQGGAAGAVPNPANKPGGGGRRASVKKRKGSRSARGRAASSASKGGRPPQHSGDHASPPRLPGKGGAAYIVMTQVQDAKALGEAFPGECGAALSVLEGALARLCASHAGERCNHYGEVSPPPADSHSFVFERAAAAVAFATELQSCLLSADWPEAILQHELWRGVQDPSVSSTSTSTPDGTTSAEQSQPSDPTTACLWRGLRVRCAIHVGALSRDDPVPLQMQPPPSLQRRSTSGSTSSEDTLPGAGGAVGGAAGVWYGGSVMVRCSRILTGTCGGEVLLSSRAKAGHDREAAQRADEGQQDIGGGGGVLLTSSSPLAFEEVEAPLRPNRRGDVWRVYPVALAGRHVGGGTAAPNPLIPDAFPATNFWKSLVARGLLAGVHSGHPGQRVGSAGCISPLGRRGSDTPDGGSPLQSPLQQRADIAALEDAVDRGNELNTQLLVHIAESAASQETLREVIEALERQGMANEDALPGTREYADCPDREGRQKAVSGAVLRMMQGRKLRMADSEALQGMGAMPGHQRPSLIAGKVRGGGGGVLPLRGGGGSQQRNALGRVHLAVSELHRLLRGFLQSGRRSGDAVLAMLMRTVSGSHSMPVEARATARSVTRQAIEHTDLPEVLPNSALLANSIVGHIVKVFLLVRDTWKQVLPKGLHSADSMRQLPRGLPSLRKRQSSPTIFNVPGIENRQRVLREKWQKRRTGSLGSNPDAECVAGPPTPTPSARRETASGTALRKTSSIRFARKESTAGAPTRGGGGRVGSLRRVESIGKAVSGTPASPRRLAPLQSVSVPPVRSPASSHRQSGGLSALSSPSASVGDAASDGQLTRF